MRNLFVAVVALICVPSFALASSVVRTGDTVQVSTDQVVAGDFYALGGTIAISGKVEQDLLLMGGTVTLNGEAGADIAVLGGTVSFHGVAKDDVRIVGGKVTIAGQIAGNLVVVASELEVLSTAEIAGDVLFFGDKADIAGLVGGDILGTNNQLRIDGVVKGGMDVKVSNLTLGERADIAENVAYVSGVELVRAQNANIGGEVIRTAAVVVKENTARDFLIPFLITLFAALVWYLLFKQFVGTVATVATGHPLRGVLIGFAILFLAPIAATILLVSTLGSIVGITILALYFLLLFVGISLVGVVTGSYFAGLISKEPVSPVLYIIGGVTLLHLLTYIPVIGPGIVFGLFLMTLGVVAERGYTFLRSK